MASPTRNWNMAQAHVSKCVISIIASFTSGLDVFRKFQKSHGKKKTRRSKNAASLDDDELRLARSLRQAPEEIGREYQRSVHGLGEQFSRGDGAAQTALAEILLRLNSGLVTIINTFLARDRNTVELDYRSLISLSEQSRVDTCRTLRQLYRRMMHPRIPANMDSSDDIHARAKATNSSRETIHGPKHHRVKGPVVARVVIADSSKAGQIAVARPGTKKKKSESTLTSNSSKKRSSTSLARHAPPPLPSRNPNASSQSLVTLPSRPRRKHSAMDFSDQRLQRRDRLRATQSTPGLNAALTRENALEEVAEMPSIAPLPNLPPRRRKQTPASYYSMESSATKLGEIPMHKWTEPYDFDAMSKLNREAQENGWPIRDLDGYQQPLTKKRGFWSFFRRKSAKV